MKNDVLARMDRGGRLGRVSYAQVDADREADLAGRLMRGNAVPQLVVFSQKQDGSWHREQITGAASEAAVNNLIERALAQQARREPATELTAGK
jgi:thioredoxin-like negative regulator of GroEL